MCEHSLVLDFGLEVVNGVGRLDFQSDGLDRQGLDKDLHASTKTKGEMKVDVIVREGSAVLHSKDKVERCAGVGWVRSESCSIVVGKDGQ